jgi:hypothetical protein
MKLEAEKKQLEAMDDFNTVAVWSQLDPLNYGYLDFNSIKEYFARYESEIMKENVQAVLRRLSDCPDGKISFREFGLGITPEVACLDQEAANIEFGTEKKLEMAEARKSQNQPLVT